MKLKFKQQKFQSDAAQAVVDVFNGQGKKQNKYIMDIDLHEKQMTMGEDIDFMGVANQKINPILSADKILDQIRRIQIDNSIRPSDKLEGDGLNLSIEMETGVGKTYTYIKTMYELYEKYGWAKYIIVVPSVAIREGVYKTFEVTEDHFASLYGHRIRYFIYDSSKLSDISNFASDPNINVIIMNYQAFNSSYKGNASESARKIFRELDEFNSRKPIDVISQTNPILILDEPQSLEGKATKERLKEFKALFTLRYSATHKYPYNMVYKLDAVDAYNEKLVKRIQVKGISQTSLTGTSGYIYFDGLNISKSAPTANLEIEIKYKGGVKRKMVRVEEGDNLYIKSNELEAYLEGLTVSQRDGRDNSIEFTNGSRLYAGDVVGQVDEDVIRRIQIRETIKSHLEKERDLYNMGIKVLSLFFIDEVANYRVYDDDNQAQNGIYADIFEEEYDHVFSSFQLKYGGEAYVNYLENFKAETTHKGYFSVDKKGRLKNTKGDSNDDVSTYDLIMKNKELLLDRDPKKSQVRFIFSHSALKEGWDNPNVFQICTLKQSGSDMRKRQEVGRGLRLCVDDTGERMDENALGDSVQEVNSLTVVASESYENFAKALQNEYYEDSSGRARKVNPDLFEGRILNSSDGEEKEIDKDLALKIYDKLKDLRYIDDQKLTEKFYDDKKADSIDLGDDLRDYQDSLIGLLDRIYNRDIDIIDARSRNVYAKLREDKLKSQEFQKLWDNINQKTYYVVDFESDELVENCIAKINAVLNIQTIKYEVKTGYIEQMSIDKKDFSKNIKEVNEDRTEVYGITNSTKYDLVGKIAKDTQLTRKDVVKILKGISEDKFLNYKKNPEEFISKVSQIINDEKAVKIIQHITYDLLEDKYENEIFTEANLKGQLGKSAISSEKGIFDFTIYDSDIERDFSKKLDSRGEVAVYVKLPSSFYISTPVGKYNPDWAIAFKEEDIKHIYFVAETKGSNNTLQLRNIETAKISCAKKHFEKISGDKVRYGVVSSFEELLDIVSK